ncbi:unnamed protein product [Brassica napus]|uniref:(rape) hypothetical protein n=1 Tax=Brassica napus TaxID=3708 RepID=A0A816YG47_BRANA|nr:unnamed protein product [Brassica napus]
MKGLKRKCPSTGGGVSSRTRARKAVSNGNEPVREESNPVSGTTVVSLSLDTESEGMSAVSSKGTPTSTGVIVITPRGRTKAAAARKAISISPEIVVVTGEKNNEQEAMVIEQEAIQTEIAELAEKEAEVEATHTVQEAIQTEIVEKEAEDLTGGMYFSVGCYEFDTNPDVDQDVEEEEEKAEERENNLVESPSEKHAELAEKSVESDVDQDVEEEEEKAEKIEDNPVESPAKKQTELAEKSVEVEIKTMCKPRVKVIAVQYGIPRAERLAKMRAEAEKRKLKLMVHLRRKVGRSRLRLH